jgi:hypothetical protein
MEASMIERSLVAELKQSRIDAVQKILDRPTLPDDMWAYWADVLEAVQTDFFFELPVSSELHEVAAAKPEDLIAFWEEDR